MIFSPTNFQNGRAEGTVSALPECLTWQIKSPQYEGWSIVWHCLRAAEPWSYFIRFLWFQIEKSGHFKPQISFTFTLAVIVTPSFPCPPHFSHYSCCNAILGSQKVSMQEVFLIFVICETQPLILSMFQASPEVATYGRMRKRSQHVLLSFMVDVAVCHHSLLPFIADAAVCNHNWCPVSTRKLFVELPAHWLSKVLEW